MCLICVAELSGGGGGGCGKSSLLAAIRTDQVGCSTSHWQRQHNTVMTSPWRHGNDATMTTGMTMPPWQHGDDDPPWQHGDDDHDNTVMMPPWQHGDDATMSHHDNRVTMPPWQHGDVPTMTTRWVTMPPWQHGDDATMTTWWWQHGDDATIPTMTTWWCHHDNMVMSPPWQHGDDATMTTRWCPHHDNTVMMPPWQQGDVPTMTTRATSHLDVLWNRRASVAGGGHNIQTIHNIDDAILSSSFLISKGRHQRVQTKMPLDAIRSVTCAKLSARPPRVVSCCGKLGNPCTPSNCPTRTSLTPPQTTC